MGVVWSDPGFREGSWGEACRQQGQDLVADGAGGCLGYGNANVPFSQGPGGQCVAGPVTPQVSVKPVPVRAVPGNPRLVLFQ